VSVCDGTTERNICADGAIVRTLCTRVAVVGPTKWLLCELGGLGDKSVLLLNTIPSLLSGDIGMIPDFFSIMSEICVGWNKLLAGVVFPVP